MNLIPYVQLLEIEGISLTAKYSRRDDYLPLSGLMQKESIARAQIYDLAYRGIEEVSTSLNLTIRNKNYTDTYKQLGFLDTEQLLIRSQSKFNFLGENIEWRSCITKYQPKSRQGLKKFL